MGKEKCLRNRLDSGISGAAPPRDAKPTHRRGLAAVDQNWAKLGQNLANRPVGSNAELKSERQNGNFGLKRLFAFDFGCGRL